MPNPSINLIVDHFVEMMVVEVCFIIEFQTSQSLECNNVNFDLLYMKN